MFVCSFSLRMCTVSTILFSHSNDITVIAGGVLNLTCEALGIPEPTITWNGPGDSDNITSEDILQTTVSQNGSELVVSVLQLRSLQLSDAGIYSCTAVNTVVGGIVTEDSRSFTLTVHCKKLVLHRLLPITYLSFGV